jgi:hypothetical protein
MATEQRKTGLWRKILAGLLVVLLLAGWAGYRFGRPFLYGLEAYVYGFPLVVMDLTREQMTSVPQAGEFFAPVNQFAVMTKYPDASFKVIPRTGLDTLFATAWVDVGPEPMVLSVPDTGGRYYVIALFDLWSDVFASIGKRTTGTKAGNYLIAGSGWNGTVPADVTDVYHAPTRWVWVNGQMQADGPKDYDAVNTLQKQYKLTPLSQWGKTYTPPFTVAVSETSAPASALDRVAKMDANAFFGRLAALMNDNPPAEADAAMIEKLKAVGITPGEPFDFAKLDSATAWGLTEAMRGYEVLQKGVTKLKTENGWIVMPKDMANYGTDYETRAGIALVGLGAIQSADVVYPAAFIDGDGKPLDGAKSYVLHFDKSQWPPTQATWSVSLYDPEGFYIANPINRFSLSAWMPLTYNADGSLDIWIQSEPPEDARMPNWLPSPASGTFNLVVRDYWPTEAVLDGSYALPPVRLQE